MKMKAVLHCKADSPIVAWYYDRVYQTILTIASMGTPPHQITMKSIQNFSVTSLEKGGFDYTLHPFELERRVVEKEEVVIQTTQHTP